MSTLRYKIKEIPSEGRIIDEPIARSLLADALDGTDAELDASRAKVHLELHKTGHDVFARGKLSGTVVVPCGACLAAAEVPLDVRLDMTFVPEGDEDDAAVSDDPLDDVEVATHDLDTVDLEPIVREQIILALPISPRCQPGCKGLCASCGQNKNERDCGHTGAEVPSALAIELQRKLNLQPKKQ
jgi:uncharacterized protein